MKIGIVGGNSQVGTELAFLLRDSGHEVIPIVRSRRAGGLLGSNGFNCRIGSITDRDEASELLAELDAVIIAAYATASSRNVLGYREAWQTNTAIVDNSINESSNDATVIYLSTVSAFGNKRYDSLLKGRFDHYTISKRRLERRFRKRARSYGKSPYVLRLGYVHGPLQSKTRNLREALQGTDRAVIRVSGDAGSNVVHTVTVAAAVERCLDQSLDPGRYTVIDNPRWSWSKLIDRYSPSGVELEFSPGSSQSIVSSAANRVLGYVTDFAIGQKDKLMSFQVVLPTSINERIVYRYQREVAMGRLRGYDFERVVTYDIPEFEANPVEGNTVENLENINKLLERESVIQDALDSGFSCS